MTVVEGPGTSGFVGQINRNQTSATYSYSNTAGTPQSVSSSWSGTADLTSYTLRQLTSASNNGLDSSIDHVDSATISWLADTFTYDTPQTGNVTVNVSLDGSFTSNTTGAATVINSTYLQFYFLQPGSLDSPNIADPANVIASPLYGVGPDFQDNPYFSYGTPAGLIALPGTASYSVPTSSLPSGFQLIVLLQSYIVASTGGSGTFDYTMDLSHTVHIDVTAPAGMDLVAASSVPEPSSWTFAGLGMVVVAFTAWSRRRKSAR